MSDGTKEQMGSPGLRPRLGRARGRGRAQEGRGKTLQRRRGNAGSSIAEKPGKGEGHGGPPDHPRGTGEGSLLGDRKVQQRQGGVLND